LTALRLHVKAGVAALDRGDFTDVDDAELETYLQECSRSAEGRQVQRLDRQRFPRHLALAKRLIKLRFSFGQRAASNFYATCLCPADFFVEPTPGPPVEIGPGADK
jgi:hypothetical protein